MGNYLVQLMIYVPVVFV